MGRFMDAIHAFSAPKAERVTETGNFGWCPTGFDGGLFPFQQVAAGEVVTPNTALASSAVYASVRVLAETISTLPLKIFQTMDGGGKRLATEHPLNVPLRLMPNVYQNKVTFLDQGVTHLNLRGNAFAKIISGPRFGAVDELRPIHPDAVKKIEMLENSRLRYTVRLKGGSEEIINQDDMLHISGPVSQDGVLGLSPIELHRQGIGLDLAAEKYGGKFFGNGQQSSLSLTVPKEIKLDAQGVVNLRNDYMNQHGGDNQLGITVLRDGITAEPMAMSGRDAQHIETRKFQVSDIARIFRVPPHLIGDLDRSTFNNIEEMGIAFVEYSLVPWLTRIELALMTQLMSDEDLQAGFFIEFIVEGLLRGSLDKRFASYQIGINSGIYSPNEVRRLENLNPREGGDEFLESQNTRPSGVADAEVDVPEILSEHVEPAAFVADAAKRIANAEIREIGKHIKHAGTDREKFDTWFESYMTSDNHRKYVNMVVEPFGVDAQTVMTICENFASQGSLDDMVGWWKDNSSASAARAACVATMIREGMNSHDE